MYRTIDDVRRANHYAGQYYFERDTMRFFGSRIGGTLYGGRFFVTSELSGFESWRPRRYSVRVALDNGSIETAGEFLEYTSSAAANRAAARMAAACGAGRVEVRPDPYAGERDPETGERAPGDPPARGEYGWRPFVVLERGAAVPIGSRTTHHAAHKLKRELLASG